MAIIRPQEINPVNFGEANRLRMAGQQMLTGGIGGIQDALKGYRGAIVDQNTANAVGLLTGAKDVNDLGQRQQQVASLLQQAGGDIDANAINKANLTMPDTLMSRQNTTNQLKQYDISQHDAPIQNAIMQRYMAGDFAGAQQLAGTLQGDASKAFAFGANRKDAADAERARQAQLGIAQQGLALRRQAAERSGAGNKQMQTLLKQLLQPGTDAAIEGGNAVADQQGKNAEAQAKANPLNNPKNDLTSTINQLNSDSEPWYAGPANLLAYTSPLNLGLSAKNGTDPRWVKGEVGNTVSKLAKAIPGYDSLNPEQQNNLVAQMGQRYTEANTLFGNKNPEEVANTWGTNAISDLKKANTAELSATAGKINNKRTQREQMLQQMLPYMLNGSSLSQYNPYLEE